jgi:hypothetical protein
MQYALREAVMRFTGNIIGIFLVSVAMPAWSQEAPTANSASQAATTSGSDSQKSHAPAKTAKQFTLPATAIAEPYADSAGEAVKICCYAAYCSFWGINECNILSPEGKVIAFIGMGVGGIAGFVFGTGIAVAGYGGLVASGPIPVYEVPSDELLSLSFLSAAAGTVTGAGLGALVGFGYDGTLHFLLPKKKPRRLREPPKEQPPHAPVDDPPPAY